ncbi:MAG: lysine--tRNA ligase [Rickettsiales bacterium]|nr:lysine--tRNA ligase [Rickettsiales bacterium]
MNTGDYKKITAWPFIEARKLIKTISTNKKSTLNFETGYGPSGVPHIGTFAEVLRTNMVKNAINQMYDIETRLITFSDDMDALKKVPDDYPFPEKLEKFVDYPLSSIPDFTGRYSSYADRNNSLLKDFLNEYDFNYEFISSTTKYKSGEFDKYLMKVLDNYESIINVVLPTLRKERRNSYSPFLPISKDSGKTLQVPIKIISKKNGLIAYKNENNKFIETLVTGGNCKLQWKVDWAMRWSALDIDYEMNGKDLIPSFELSKQIAKFIFHKVPENMSYELFLDDKGEKISKSKGNGLSIEEWTKYGTRDSLSFFMYQNPKRAKRLYFDCIPRSMDDYKKLFDKISSGDDAEIFENPIWHIHQGKIPKKVYPIEFSSLLNLVTALNTNDDNIILKFVKLYLKEKENSDNEHLMKNMIKLAVAYFEDFILPTLKKKIPDEKEKKALKKLISDIKDGPKKMEAEDFQKVIYENGKKVYPEELRTWFKTLYKVLFGSENGPRLGSFFFYLWKRKSN